MPDEPKPKAESYTHCPKCSEQMGEPIFYPKNQVKFVEPFFDFAGMGPHYECPEGHTVVPPWVKKEEAAKQ